MADAHRAGMTGFLHSLGAACGRRPWRVVSWWLLAAVLAVLLNTAFGGAPDDTFQLPGSEAQRGADVIADRFPQQSLSTSDIVFHTRGGLTATDRSAVSAAVTALRDDPHVQAVSDPFHPAPAVSVDGSTAVATIAYDQDAVTPTMFEAATAAVQGARDTGMQVEFAGALGYAGGTSGGGELVGILVAVVVLSAAFGSLVAASLPIAVTLLAVLIGSGLLGLLSGVVAVPTIASIVGLMLGLGVGIDYALFIVSRYRQSLVAGVPVTKAVAQATATAGRSVLFAGVTVVLAIIGVQLSGIPMLAMMGWGAALMVLVTMLAALTLLPALLSLVGHRIGRLRVPFIRTDPAEAHSLRWVARVVAHPTAYGAAVVLVLVALATPTLSMRLAFPDAGNDPAASTTRRAYDLMAAGFGPGAGAPLAVVIEGPAGGVGGRVAAAAQRVAERVAREPGVAAVAPPVTNDHGDVALVSLVPATSPQDERTSALLRRLRTVVLPAAGLPYGATVAVTGGTAMADDVAQQLGHRMPVFLSAVIGLSFVLLILVFRSVLIPAKAAVLNLLSVGASYGVVVAVFQWGWGAALIGVDHEVPIMPLAPMLMFAILFGLSMDYEVFLISRVREQYAGHGDARRAICEGVGATGRVITSAAAIMVAVFASFVLDPDPTTKLFGVGLSIAVLLDVTLVRMVLVPAAMSLLGDRAWWLPRRPHRQAPGRSADPIETGALGTTTAPTEGLTLHPTRQKHGTP